jgi:hybrid cluster-associated redox disulfide protein
VIKMVKKKITGQSLILDVIRSYPQTRKVLARHDMACRGCLGAEAETVVNGAVTHGIDPALFIAELNAALEEN